MPIKISEDSSLQSTSPGLVEQSLNEKIQPGSKINKIVDTLDPVNIVTQQLEAAQGKRNVYLSYAQNPSLEFPDFESYSPEPSWLIAINKFMKNLVKEMQQKKNQNQVTPI